MQTNLKPVSNELKYELELQTLGQKVRMNMQTTLLASLELCTKLYNVAKFEKCRSRLEIGEVYQCR